MRTDFIRTYFYWNLKLVSSKRWTCTKILYKYFQQALTWNPIFFSSFVNSRRSYPSLVTHIRTRCSFCPIILVFFFFFFFFSFLLIPLLVCIVMVVIRMPNDGLCPFQVVTPDADMGENINFNG